MTLHNNYSSDSVLLSLWWWYVDESHENISILTEALESALGASWYSILQYNDCRWAKELREIIQNWAPDFYWIPHFPSENFVITNGITSSIDLVARTILHKKFDAFVFEPCYDTALKSIAYSARSIKSICPKYSDNGFLSISEDEWTEIDKIFQDSQIRLVYVIPYFSNPTGMTLSEKDRRRLLAICKKYGAYIFEDDPYKLYAFWNCQSVIPSLYEMDTERNTVFYANSVSKVCFPWIRIWFLVWPKEQIFNISELQKYTTSSPNLLAQGIAAVLIKRWQINQIYENRFSVMMRKFEYTKSYFIKNNLVSKTNLILPNGGFYFWWQVIDSDSFVQRAKEKWLILIPGRIYWHNSDFSNRIRITFSQISEKNLPEALSRLEWILL